MKYRILGIAATAVMLIAAMTFSGFSSDHQTQRVHQHLTARQPDAGCSCAGDELCTHLPLLIVDTAGVEIPGEPLSSDGTPLDQTDMEYEYTGVTLAADGSKTIVCSMAVIDNQNGNNHPSDDPAITSTARIRIRGNTSRLHDKKGYLIVTTEEDGLTNRDVELMGMDSHHEWALHGPYLDKSLIRNYMWYNIGGEIMDYAPNARFCEVILNGEYQGLYVAVETITNGDGSRLSMSLPESDSQSSISYVIRLDRGSSTEIKNIETFSMYSLRTLNLIDIVYPGLSNLTEDRAAFIRQDFSDFEKSLYSYDYDTEPYAWWNQADLDSFAEYFLINEFTCNYDVGGRSTYMYKDVRGKYKMVIWDMNSSCDNFHNSYMEPQGFHLKGITWFTMLMRDETFVNRVIEIYRELRDTYLSDEYLTSYIDSVVEYLGPATERNFEVWGYTFEEYRPLDPDSRNPRTYEDAVEQLREFCLERGAWMDENVDTLLQFCHESRNKKYNH